MKGDTDLIDKLLEDVNKEISDLEYELIEGHIFKEKFDYDRNELEKKRDKIIKSRPK